MSRASSLTRPSRGYPGVVSIATKHILMSTVLGDVMPLSRAYRSDLIVGTSDELT